MPPAPPRSVLACRPTTYTLRYAINPWMLDQQIDAGQARTQFDVLVRTYEHIGLQIDYIEQDPKLPDMVFTANAGLIHDRTFIPSNFRYPERAPEAQLFADHFRAGGFRIESLAPEYLFEGAGDAI